MTFERQWKLPADRMLRPREVAAAFDVSAKTVSRWANAGKLPYVRTIGGHRRFALTAVEAMLCDPRPSDADDARPDAGQPEGAADAQRLLPCPKWEDEAL